MKYKLKNLPKILLLQLLKQPKYRYRTRKYRYQYKYQNGGFILPIVISMILILTSLLIAYTLLLKIDTSTTKASAKSNTGFYAAEAGLNIRAKQVQDKFVGYNRPQGSSPSSWEDCVDGDTTNDGSNDFACSTQTFNDQKLITYVEEGDNNPNAISIPAGEPFAGLSAQEYRYDVTSVAVSSENNPTAIESMRFKSRLVPLFQFLTFYNNDLDFAVPPSMNLVGPIHTNGDLYLDASSTLSINGQVSTAGRLYRGNKIDNNCNGTVNIYDLSTARTLSCGSGRTTYSQSSVSAWNNQIRIGIDPLTVPLPDALNPTPGKTYWDKADLRVVLKLDPSSGNPSGIEVRDQYNNRDNTATTNLLNSCTVTPSTILQNEAAGDSNYEADDITLRVTSTAGFKVGDVVVVGTDYDSNVIAGPDIDNDKNVDSGTTIILKRQLGHTYQTSPIASAGNSVRKAIVSTSNTFYNYREKNGGSGPNAGKFIRMLNVDVQGLLNCAYSQNLMGKALNENTDGGLVWFLTVVDGPNSTTDVTAGGSPNNYGVRLYNGTYLYSRQSSAPEIQGLTVVSDQAVYIRGDYNLKDDPATGTNEGDDPTTASVTERWRPAAILADTINVLSNAWNMDDSYSRQYSLNVPNPIPSSGSTISGGTTAIANRSASATKINTAFLGGNEIPGGANGTAYQGGGWSSSGGGLNNYPRFHEDWSGINLTYRGSFISLNKPRRVNGPWCGSSSINSSCNIYNPPNRNWNYDTDFNNAANLPPLTPRIVYLRQEVFLRNFDR